jgi:hypothetical protein
MKNVLLAPLTGCLLAFASLGVSADDTRLPAYPPHGPGMMMGPPGYGMQMSPEQRQQHWEQMQQHHYQMHGPQSGRGYGGQMSPEQHQQHWGQMQQHHQQQGMHHRPGMMEPRGWRW